jgi:hypothetical protein
MEVTEIRGEMREEMEYRFVPGSLIGGSGA